MRHLLQRLLGIRHDLLVAAVIAAAAILRTLVVPRHSSTSGPGLPGRRVAVRREEARMDRHLPGRELLELLYPVDIRVDLPRQLDEGLAIMAFATAKLAPRVPRVRARDRGSARSPPPQAPRSCHRSSTFRSRRPATGTPGPGSRSPPTSPS